MSNITDLKAAWLTQIETIADSLIKAEALVALDRYIDTYTKQAELENGTIESYSIAGRSVTHRKPDEGTGLVESIRAELWRMVYGKTSLIDLNNSGQQGITP